MLDSESGCRFNSVYVTWSRDSAESLTKTSSHIGCIGLTEVRLSSSILSCNAGMLVSHKFEVHAFHNSVAFEGPDIRAGCPKSSNDKLQGM